LKECPSPPYEVMKKDNVEEIAGTVKSSSSLQLTG
jgi:hypothetical protein